jgi:hypothetical protein
LLDPKIDDTVTARTRVTGATPTLNWIMKYDGIVVPILIMVDVLVALVCAMMWISPVQTFAVLIANPLLFSAEFAYLRARRTRSAG